MNHTESTHQIFAFLLTYDKERRHSPSLTEIAQHCFLSVTAVRTHLSRLEAWGWIRREPGKARSITILRQTEEGS
jgi:DNA-binding MarR family transcriptional regulator